MIDVKGFPAQQLPFSKKTKEWRKRCVDWGANKLHANSSYIRNTVRHKQINYDLLNGKLHMSDLKEMMNPVGIKADFIPEDIPHYPIMNSKLNVLRGEESKRIFDCRVIVTNPTSISEMENEKRDAVYARLQEFVQNQSQDEDELNKNLDEISEFFTFQYQDMREVRGNCVLNHYNKEYNMPAMFNKGFVDALAVAEEIYQCDIVSGEPVVYKLNPKKVQVLRSGFSNKIEDADMIIIDDYWNPGKVVDTYHEFLSEKDMKYITNLSYNDTTGSSNDMGNVDERLAFVRADGSFVNPNDPLEFNEYIFGNTDTEVCAPFDEAGNIRVLRIYWKSKRKIKKVKTYDPMTGEENFTYYPENYTCNPTLGEEEESRWINEAWEGTRIGEDIYVNMQPRVIQYNRSSNPSRCHFGIIGTIYNINEERAYSFVDMMKQYNYLYDVIHDRLNRIIARNKGKLVSIDFSKKPGKWDTNKWIYFMEALGYYVTDSFNEGQQGAATGKLAGALNNASNGVIDAELGNVIQQYINLLEFIKLEMSEVCGITRQREGQVSNRETVGGVERATLQSSHITEWLFVEHEDLKKRVYECFLETAKICMRGRTKKFQYLLSDGTLQLIEINGDQFAECDYGLVVDSSSATQEFAQKLETYAQAAMQNQMTSFSTIFKMYSTASIVEKQRIVEKDEKEIRERQAQAQQQQLEVQQQIAQQQQETEREKLKLQDTMNQRDNETKVLIATMQQESQAALDNDGIKEPEYTQEAKDKLNEQIREFNERLKLDKERLDFDKNKSSKELKIKEKQVNKKPTSNNK
jgi:hypothetical protein